MLNYQIHGDLSHNTTPLVVLHGLLGSLENWNTFAKQQQRPIIALDMRNHGRSPHVEGLSYTLMAEDVDTVLRHLGLAQIDLIGHSMGGKVAMLLALNQTFPLQHLIIVDIAPISYPPHHQALLQALLAINLSSLSNRKQAEEQLQVTVPNGVERAFLLKNLARDPEQGFHWRCHLSEIARHYLKLTTFPTLASTYTGKTCFIAGKRSTYLRPERWQQTQPLFPTAKIVSIPDAGHLPHVETPAAFTQVVNDFLQS